LQTHQSHCRLAIRPDEHQEFVPHWVRIRWWHSLDSPRKHVSGVLGLLALDAESGVGQPNGRAELPNRTAGCRFEDFDCLLVLAEVSLHVRILNPQLFNRLDAVLINILLVLPVTQRLLEHIPRL
jgi:hypothetical protein